MLCGKLLDLRHEDFDAYKIYNVRFNIAHDCFRRESTLDTVVLDVEYNTSK